MKNSRHIVAALISIAVCLHLWAGPAHAQETQEAMPMPDRKIIFIGDSRTVEMYGNVNQVNIAYDIFQEDIRGDFWSARIGAKYDWMTGTGVPVAEGQMTGDTAVVFLMGVNDCGTEDAAGMAMEYADYINAKAEEWSIYGIETYFVSVNPINGDYWFYDILFNNTSVEKFNSVMKAQLSDRVTYIDTYSQIADSFISPDQLHYEYSTYLEIYRLIMKALAEDLPAKDLALRLKQAADPARRAEALDRWQAESLPEDSGNALVYGSMAGLAG